MNVVVTLADPAVAVAAERKDLSATAAALVHKSPRGEAGCREQEDPLGRRPRAREGDDGAQRHRPQDRREQDQQAPGAEGSRLGSADQRLRARSQRDGAVHRRRGRAGRWRGRHGHRRRDHRLGHRLHAPELRRRWHRSGVRRPRTGRRSPMRGTRRRTGCSRPRRSSPGFDFVGEFWPGLKPGRAAPAVLILIRTRSTVVPRSSRRPRPSRSGTGGAELRRRPWIARVGHHCRHRAEQGRRARREALRVQGVQRHLHVVQRRGDAPVHRTRRSTRTATARPPTASTS